MPQRTQWGLAVASSGLLFLGTQPLKAEEAGQNPAEQRSSGVLEEIVVTAQKRVESLQDVAASVTAIQASSLQDAGVDMAKSLAMLTPNLVIGYQANFAAPYIRGVGTELANPGLESSVATYLDDLYLPRASSGLLSFYDVERVEVLEGPQGTLYGMNTTGGAIRIITRDPTPEFHAGAGFTGGNIGSLGGDAFVNGQIAPGLDGRVAIQYDHNNGYVKDILPGAPKLDNRNLGMFRGKLHWTVSDQLSVRLMVDYEEKKDHEGQAFQSFYPGAPQTLGVILGGKASPSFYTSTDNITSPQENHLKLGGAELRVDYDLQSARLSAITGYRYTEFSGFADLDTTSAPLLGANTIMELTRDFSEEFQAVSTGSGPWSWIGGVFFLHENAADNSALGGQLLSTAIGVPNVVEGGYGHESQDVLAPYGQVSYSITPQWELTAGARYTSQQETNQDNQFYVTTATQPFNLIPSTPYLRTPPPSGRQQFMSNTLAPKVALTWRPLAGAMFYVSYTKAYKSGGFDLPQPAPTPPQEVQDELLKATEVGWKTQFGPVRFNGAYFHYAETNLQVTATTPTGITQVNNAASATTNGFESTIDVAAARGLVIGGSVGYLKAKFDNYPLGAVNQPCVVDPTLTGCNALRPIGIGNGNRDLSGKDVPFAPRWTGNLHIDYTLPLPSDLGSVKLSAIESYIGSYFWTADDFYRRPSIALLNSSISWVSANSRYNIRIFGTNLTSKEYNTSLVPLQTGVATAPGAPREYGARIGVEF